MHQYSFEKLEVWQDARKLAVMIYKLTEKFPKEERYSLSDQMRRSAISVGSNLAEGTARSSNRDRAHFTNISYGSLMELMSQAYTALDLNYITQIEIEAVKEEINKISNKLNSLRRYQLNALTP